MVEHTVGSLCAGYGGLEQGLAQVMDVKPAWYSEIDPGASAVLAHRFPKVPNHGDLTATDWLQVEPVDVMTAGWPCQPWSQAGKRKGAEDERAIWPYVAAAIRAVRPRYVFLENVEAIAGFGELARAAGDLAQAGYVGAWRSVRASSVGAPHRRARIFILAANTTHVGHQRDWTARFGGTGSADGGGSAADTTGAGWGLSEPLHVGEDSTPAAQRAGEAEPGRRDRAASDTQGERRGEGRPESAGQLGGSDAALAGDAAAHPDRHGRERRPQRDSEQVEPRLEAPLGADVDGRVLDWAGYRPAIERWETLLGRRAPAPTVLGRRGGRQLNPVFVEFLMGLPAGWVCDVPGLTRNQKLKVLGNGVVPQQCAAALRHLLPLVTEAQAGEAA